MRRHPHQTLQRTFVRRAFFALGGVLLAGGAIWWALRGGSDSSSAPRSWNIVLITLDTTRADRLGCYDKRHETSAIDALSRDGVRFECCLAPVPLTLPSHCSLLTGLVPARHGVHDNGPDRLSSQADTLAEVLSRQGYTTAAIVGSFVLDRRFGLDQGFDHYDDRMPTGLAPDKFRYAERNAGQVTDAALAWLKKNQRSGPVFLWLHYFDAHAPYAPPGYDPKLATAPPYDAEIVYVDSQLSRLFAGLAQHLATPTLVILTADHGEGLGQHGEDTHGLFTYNQTLRVPLVVRFPDHRHAGRVIREPVGLIDVMPSILAWLGLNGPGPMDGLPLLSHRADDESAPPGDRAIYFENRFPQNMYGWSSVDGVALGRHKLIRAPRPEVYDLQSDPNERTNLFTSDAALSQKLMAKLAQVTGELTSGRVLTGPAAAVSGEDLARLRSLGYVGGAKSPRDVRSAAEPKLPDPKDMLAVYGKIQDVTLLMEQRQTAKAVELLLAVLDSQDPANKRALRLLAALAPEDPQLRAKSIARLEQAVSDSGRPCTDAFVLGKLGLALLADRRAAEAADVLTRLVQVESSAAACRQLADAYRQLGQNAEAGHWLHRAQELTRSTDQPPEWAADAEGPGRPGPAR